MKGRAASDNPSNRFERVRLEIQHGEQDPAADDSHRLATEFIPDRTQSLITRNDSPDVGFNYSMNPYRGCEHGCAYCYARPTHEYLGFGAGLDFETKILVKHEAAAILRRELNRPGWQAEVIALSGNTDCYQPAERRFGLTRGLLAVALEARQPLAIVTKNALALRDLDLLVELAAAALVHVNVSINTLDAGLARALEPRTSSPAARLRAIGELSAAGVPVRVLAAPVIPGLTDEALPAVLTAARQAGAQAAAYILLRLPLTVRPVFQEWLKTHAPEKAPRIDALVRATRGGRLNDSRFGRRMSGAGPYAEQIRQTFEVFAGKLGLARTLPPLDGSRFMPPRSPSGQLRLF